MDKVGPVTFVGHEKLVVSKMGHSIDTAPLPLSQHPISRIFNGQDLRLLPSSSIAA